MFKICFNGSYSNLLQKRLKHWNIQSCKMHYNQWCRNIYRNKEVRNVTYYCRRLCCMPFVQHSYEHNILCMCMYTKFEIYEHKFSSPKGLQLHFSSNFLFLASSRIGHHLPNSILILAPLSPHYSLLFV